ncbi:MAG TPA: rhomboid family intramembrane serine protease, partial [Fimbriimonadaceae bacterium]|nr:rhomboid family intramembrane serine protease [Fimbriimonadaceae bacterium]
GHRRWTMIGASSSIAACVGYCCVRYVRHRVPLAPTIRVPVAAIALVWVLLQAVGAFVKFGEAGGTSYVAHIGGVVAGLALAFVFRAQKDVSRERGREEMSAMAERSPAAALKAAERHLSAHPDDVGAAWQAVESLQAMGDTHRQVGLLKGLLSHSSERERAIERLERIGALAQVPSTERMRLAHQVGHDAKIALLKSVVESDKADTERPYALLALAEETGDETLLIELQSDYQFHAATELAKAKGLIQ